MRLIHAPNRSGRSRPGFTLVELLVVIGIIAVLASLVAGGIFQYITVQQTANTETTIIKVMRSLNQTKDGVLRQARSVSDKIPQGIINMAECGDGQTGARARVIWAKLRLKQALPTTFAEALAPYPTLPTTSPYYLAPNELPSLYATQLQNVVVNAPDNESSVCLALALQRSPSGVSLNLDNFSSSEIKSIDQNGLKEFVDAWHNPLVFSRWPYGAAYFYDLDGSNPARTKQRSPDPEDPQGLLLMASWNNDNNYNTQVGVYWFEQVCHSVHVGTGNTYAPKAYYVVPVVSSAGKNLKYGDNDDILSFRLRIGARGD